MMLLFSKSYNVGCAYCICDQWRYSRNRLHYSVWSTLNSLVG